MSDTVTPGAATPGAATPGAAEVIVTLRLRFKPGSVDHVLRTIVPIARLTREEPGNVNFDIFRARDDGDQLIILERWRDRAALERHWQEDYTKKVLSLFEQNLATPLSEADDVTYLEDVMRSDRAAP